VRIPHEEWQGAIDSLPNASPDKSNDYFAAWGKFSDVSQLPQTLLIDAPDGIADGTLKQDYERNDYVLVTEHRWRETLTDVVTLDDMHEARQELVTLVLPLAEKFLRQAYGNDHDVRPLIDWLHQQGAPLFYELTDAYFDLRVRGLPLNDPSVVAAIEPILKRHGISIRDDRGAVVNLDELIPRQIRHLLTEKLRRQDGSPAEEATLVEFSKWLGIQPLAEGEGRPERLDQIVRQIVAERFQSEEALGVALKPLVVRILGVYGSDLGPTRNFEYRQEMPGLLVETSGELISDRITRWRFADDDAYPSGYTMACRSLEPSVELEQKLLGKQVLKDRQSMLRYVDLVRENAPLLAVMQICADEGSLKSLKREYELLTQAGDDGATDFGKLLALLESK
jgi:hypothetical protein